MVMAPLVLQGTPEDRRCKLRKIKRLARRGASGVDSA